MLLSILGIIQRNRHFLIFILLFAYAQSIHSRILVRRALNIYTFTPDAAIATVITTSVLFLVMNFIIRFWQKSAVFSIAEMLKVFGTSLIIYLAIVKLIGLIIALIFGNVERNFNSETLIQSTFTNLLDGFIYGSFFLVFYYYKKHRKQQEQLTVRNQALYESRVSKLKAQLNPHFLFNNLNVLDQLIYEDKNKASDFLNEFAEIYRYVLHSTTQSFVSIKEELDFAERYFNLIKHKYGNAYLLKKKLHNIDGFIIPLTLQLLIENAIKHNLGTEGNPVQIDICIADTIFVSNNRIPKRIVISEPGKALSNLREQYLLLTKKQVEIQELGGLFSVIIPKI